MFDSDYQKSIVAVYLSIAFRQFCVFACVYVCFCACLFIYRLLYYFSSFYLPQNFLCFCLFRVFRSGLIFGGCKEEDGWRV